MLALGREARCAGTHKNPTATPGAAQDVMHLLQLGPGSEPTAGTLNVCGVGLLRRVLQGATEYNYLRLTEDRQGGMEGLRPQN